VGLKCAAVSCVDYVAGGSHHATRDFIAVSAGALDIVNRYSRRLRNVLALLYLYIHLVVVSRGCVCVCVCMYVVCHASVTIHQLRVTCMQCCFVPFTSTSISDKV